jgi:hypothetical protein
MLLHGSSLRDIHPPMRPCQNQKYARVRRFDSNLPLIENKYPYGTPLPSYWEPSPPCPNQDRGEATFPRTGLGCVRQHLRTHNLASHPWKYEIRLPSHFSFHRQGEGMAKSWHPPMTTTPTTTKKETAQFINVFRLVKVLLPGENLSKPFFIFLRLYFSRLVPT